MSKRKKKYKTKGEELTLVELQRITRKPGSDRQAAQSLLSWYLRLQYWTPKQHEYIKAILYRGKTKKPQKPSKHHLYAIGDGESIKLGISTNVGKRLKAMQTSHPKQLKIIWKFYVGRERGPAYKAEKKLHKLCKKHRLRGEWFNPECMILVEQFSLKDRIECENEQEEHDFELIDKASIYIAL